MNKYETCQYKEQTEYHYVIIPKIVGEERNPLARSKDDQSGTYDECKDIEDDPSPFSIFEKFYVRQDRSRQEQQDRYQGDVDHEPVSIVILPKCVEKVL